MSLIVIRLARSGHKLVQKYPNLPKWQTFQQQNFFQVEKGCKN